MKQWLFCILLSLIWSCSSQVAGGDGTGSGTETTNAISGIVVNQNQQPAVARVTLLKLQEQSSEFVDSLWTDNQGRYQFEVLDTGEYALEIAEENSGMGRWIADVPYTGDSLRVDTLGPRWTLKGTVEPQPGLDNRVILRGTSWQSSIDSQGNWEMSEILPGNHVLLHQVGSVTNNKWLPIAAFFVDEEVADSIHLRPLNPFAESPQIVLDDFDDFDELNNLLVPWWTFTDDNTGGNSQVLNWAPTEFIMEDSSNNDNGMVSLNIDFGNNHPVYVGVGTNFFRPSLRYNVAVDFRSLDSIKVRVRGQNVQASLILQSPLVTKEWAKWDLGEITESWTSVGLGLESSEIVWPESSPYSPSVGGNLVDEMIFVIEPITPGAGAKFELDDVELISR